MPIVTGAYLLQPVPGFPESAPPALASFSVPIVVAIMITVALAMVRIRWTGDSGSRGNGDHTRTAKVTGSASHAGSRRRVGDPETPSNNMAWKRLEQLVAATREERS